MGSYKAGAVGVVIGALLVSMAFLLNSSYVQIVPKVKFNSEDMTHFGLVEQNFTGGIKDGSESFEYATKEEVTDVTSEKLRQRLQELERFIKKAKLHVRGTKTSEELRKAIKLMDEILGSFPKRDVIPWRKTVEPKSVCPEDYLGKMDENSQWFRVRNCTHGKLIEELVTVVIIMKDNDAKLLEDRINAFVKSLQYEYKNVQVILANNLKLTPPTEGKANVKVVTQTKPTDGELLNMLVKEVKTPYVLIGRNIEVLTNDSRLDRLIREIEILQITVASGAVRSPNGHWKMGCFQTVHRNFTLKYFEGYDESFQECVFCDFTVGPFLTDVKTLEKFPFATLQEDMGLFEDWFLRLTKNNVETILCPDSMFYVSPRQEAEKWPQLMAKWNLFELLSPKGQNIISDCVGGLLKSTPTKALSPCLMKANADATNIMMELCDNNVLICELNAGTAVGAVKFGHVLPWEKDVDINVLSRNFTNYRDMLSKIVSVTPYKKDCDDRFYNARLKQWKIDVCERFVLESETLIEMGFKPTKVLYNGHWLATPRNPGFFVRHKYGREIYQHALHYMDTGTSSRAPYKPNRFLPCRTPKEHDCLDRFNGDGNLQFKALLP